MRDTYLLLSLSLCATPPQGYPAATLLSVLPILVQSLTKGLIANNAPIRPMQALMPPCTRHILSLYEERMQRRSGTTLSIGFSLQPFLNDRFAEQTN